MVIIMEDSQIIELLFARQESALHEVSHKYSRFYKQIVRGILFDEADAEECEDDILLAIWNSIPPNRPDCLSAYIAKLARRIGIDRLRYKTRKKRDAGYTVTLSELEGCLPDTESARDAEEAETIRSVLSDFIRGLEAETQILFIRRYIYFESVSELAARFSMSENHVSVKLYRARAALRKRLQKEGIRV